MPAPTYTIPDLPLPMDLETKPVLKALALAHRYLAELKGKAAAIPNQAILINTLALQEAKASSEIENIVTTQDELFQAEIFPEGPGSAAAKEVALYKNALKLGWDSLHQSNGIITNRSLIQLFRLLKARDDGFRSLPGTELRNDQTGETVYVPPQDLAEIESHMAVLEAYINNDELCALDPLIKMAIVHHQFESIHPFPDGNGRIGRILNVLYITQKGLLDIPILYMSRYITRTKADYYRLLQSVRDDDAWEEWVLYILTAVANTAQASLRLIEGLRALMSNYKVRLRDEFPKIYSQDLLNNLFRHPYTRIEFIVSDLQVARQTAARYLDNLAEAGFVRKHHLGRSNYYVNESLLALLMEQEM